MDKFLIALNHYSSLISAFATVAAAGATIVYVILTHRLVKETREVRLSQSQPRLVADFELIGRHFFHLAVKNLGNDIAQNILITCSPAFGKLETLKLESLSPNQDFRQLLGFIDPSTLKDVVVTLEIAYENSSKVKFNITRKIDLSIFDTDAIAIKEYKEITEAIARISRDIGDQLKEIARNTKKK
ncbi:MAG: hypothetical protein WA118_08375 [Carboxydocellales bacterium]